MRPGVVVFDIGNVLIRWDPRNLFRTVFADAAEMESFLGSICDHAWNLEQDRGRSWAEAVAERIALHPGSAAAIQAYDRRWQDMVSGAIDENVAVLHGLKAAGVPVYAITNFSHGKFEECLARFPFLATFDGVVVSAREELVKPDAAIFRLFLDRYGFEAADCLFIDDSAANIGTARALGMQAILYGESIDLAARLRALGLPVPEGART